MDLLELVQRIAADTTQTSLPVFGPELALCGAIVMLLLVKVFDGRRRVDAFYVALVGAVVTLCLVAPWTYLSGAEDLPRTEIFSGMLVFDGFSVYIRALLALFLVLLVLLTRLTRVPDRADATDFYTLVFGATLGMCVMASANHLLMIFLGVEMASVPSYVLAGLLKDRRRSSEASLKYAIYGAGTAGVMLYGISLLAGVLNSAHLPTMAEVLARKLAAGIAPGEQMVLALGGLMLMVGLSFKLSAVPFHFWIPDVFEGATAEVNAFLSVASKTAALALLVRVAIGLGTVSTAGEGAAMPPVKGMKQLALWTAGPMGSESATTRHVDNRDTREPVQAALKWLQEHRDKEATWSFDTITAMQPGAAATDPLAPVRGFMAKLIALIAAVTCTFGNLAAYGQTNIKRMLAYSTIAHAGYMMMAVPAALALAGPDPQAATVAVAALAIYVAIYLFMNLGAFAVVALVRNAIGSEEIADYGGLVRRCPGVVVCFSIMLFGLIGVPPLAGFIGKFAVFAALVDGYRATADAYLMVLLWVGGINTLVALFYYLRVVKVMTIGGEPQGRGQAALPLLSFSGLFLVVVTLPLVALIFDWQGLSQLAQAAARHLIS